MNKSTIDVYRTAELPVQSAIEARMKQFTDEHRWESIFLFSPEGLLMASHGSSEIYKEENLLEFSFTLIEAVNLIDKNLPNREIIIRGKDRRILVFRYFEVWGAQYILAAVASSKKGYRRALGRLIKSIRCLD